LALEGSVEASLRNRVFGGRIHLSRIFIFLLVWVLGGAGVEFFVGVGGDINLLGVRESVARNFLGFVRETSFVFIEG